MTHSIRAALAALAIGIALTACGQDPTLLNSADRAVLEEETSPSLERSVGSATPEAVSITATTTGTTEPGEVVNEPNFQALATAPESGDLSDVDLLNDVLFIDHFGDGQLFGPATDGEFFQGEWGSSDYFAFFVENPVFIDIDNDGTDEALVISAWNGGGSGFFSELRAFDIRDGYVVELSILPYGDRAFGGIDHVAAAPDGRSAIVDVFVDGDGACCPHTLLQQRVAMAEGQLVVAEQIEEIGYVNLVNEGVSQIEFLPNTSRVMLGMFADSSESLRFNAVAGDQLGITARSGAEVGTIELTHVNTGETLDVSDSTTLASDGLYELTITTGEDAQVSEIPGWTTIELSIS